MVFKITFKTKLEFMVTTIFVKLEFNIPIFVYEKHNSSKAITSMHTDI